MAKDIDINLNYPYGGNMMNKISFKTLWPWLLVLALLCVAPILLIYYIWTQDSSVDPLIVKFQLQTCVDKGALHFEKCAAKVSDFARESLEIREERINRWLYGIAGFLALVTWFFTALAILIAAGGFLGISIFNSLREQAEEEVKKIKNASDEADATRASVEKSRKDIGEMRDEVEPMYNQMSDMKDNVDRDLTKAQEDIETLKENIEALKKKIEEANNLHNKT